MVLVMTRRIYRWAKSGGDGRQELVDLGETIETGGLLKP
jgi:hypothetical protein